MPWLALVVALGAAPLEEAVQQVKSLEFARAARTLKQAEKASGLTRDEVLQYYELKGVVSASLGDHEGAKSAFLVLLTLDPAFKFSAKVGPKISTPFFEARSLAREQPLRLGFQEVTGARVVRFSLAAPSGLVRSVRVSVTEDGVARTFELPPTPALEVKTHGARVLAKVALLGERRWVLTTEETVELGAPVVAVGKPVDVPISPPPAPPLEPREAPVEVKLSSAEPRFRPAAFTLIALGGVALTAAVVFGVLSSAARTSFASDVALTRVDALALNERAQTTALLANLGFGSAAALLATGVLVFFLGSPSGDAASAAAGSRWSLFSS